MALGIHVSNLEADAIAITSAADPGFDSEIRALFQGDSEELLKLKPFLVIISNGSTRTMVAYTLTWVLKQPGGSRITHVQSKYPDAVADAFPVRGNEIRPGEQKIDPMSIELDCGRWTGEATGPFYLKQFANWFNEYADATELHICFDAVIFDDGDLLGPNEARLEQDFLTYLNSKEDCYRSILKAPPANP